MILTKDAQLPRHCSEGFPACQERHESAVVRYGLDSEAVAGLSPRCKNIDTLPSPLSAIASPGCSTSDAMTGKDEMANGPRFVR